MHVIVFEHMYCTTIITASINISSESYVGIFILTADIVSVQRQFILYECIILLTCMLVIKVAL